MMQHTLFLCSIFKFCQIEFACINVAICDPVHYVETAFHLH